MKTKKATINCIFWISIAIIFNILTYYLRGTDLALKFLGGYLIELSLSVDNLFLFLMIFSSFNVDEEAEMKVLDYGIFVAMILRMIFIFLGVTIVNKFHGVLYVFGIILIISAIKMLFNKEKPKDLKSNLFIRMLGKIIPFTDNFQGNKFFVRRGKKLMATPLLAVLIIIEVSDIFFAIDSIPAIFSITTDPFTVYVSNICAIICLRSMYFMLSRLSKRFKYMKFGVILILIFTGIKLSILYFGIEISVVTSILIILILLLSSILASFIFP